jgi:nitrogen fixation NifU-like protein
MNNNFDLYSENVMKYFRNPKNIGKIDNPDSVSTVGNPKCGDVMKVYLKIGQRPVLKVSSKKLTVNNKKSKKTSDSRKLKTEKYIKDIKVQTLGCGAAIATSSAATQMVKGLSLKEALGITNQKIVEKLGGLPKVKYHCSLLAEQGIKKAIQKYLDSDNN